MSSCAQNQSNQDEDSAGPGAGHGSAGDHMDVMDHSGASHFLQVTDSFYPLVNREPFLVSSLLS